MLNLHDGDRITIEISKKDTETESLAFCGIPPIEGVNADDVVESGRTYTISTSAASVNLNLISTGSVYVKAIRIDKALSGETSIQNATLKAQDYKITTQGIYDLTGCRVTTPMKGHLYIINRQKVMY